MGITILVPRPSVQYWRSCEGFGNGTSESPEDVANIKSECMGGYVSPLPYAVANQPEKLVSLLLLMCMLTPEHVNMIGHCMQLLR